MHSPIPALNQEWGGYCVRRATPNDAAVLDEWANTERDGTIREMVRGVAGHARDRKALCLVLRDLSVDLPRGCFFMRKRFFQVLYVRADLRRRGLGLRGAAVAVQHYFTTTTEPDLGTDHVLKDGRQVLSALGFGAPKHLGDKMALTREDWSTRAMDLSALFT